MVRLFCPQKKQEMVLRVVKRLFRTLKEQIIYGRVYETIEDLKVAVDKFVSYIIRTGALIGWDFSAQNRHGKAS